MDILTVFWLRGLKNRGKSIFSQHLMARIVALKRENYGYEIFEIFAASYCIATRKVSSKYIDKCEKGRYFSRADLAKITNSRFSILAKKISTLQ